jgi:hypothetical protein
MGCGRGWGAAVFAAVALIFCCVWTFAPATAEEDDETRVILFSGRDLWRDGAFAYGGLLVAPGGFEDDGFLLKLLLSGGIYRYRAGDLDGQTVIGAEGTAQILPGWRIKRHGIELKFFFGPDFERHKLWPGDPGNRLQGTDIGLRMALEFWTEPTANTLVNGDLSLSTIATSWNGRVAYGWRVLDDLFEDGFYLGPELQYFNSDGYRHARVGLHVTGLKSGASEWSAAAGWARDSDGRSGPYVRLNVLQRL